MAAFNLTRQQQCIGTPFMFSPLIDNFGYLANEELAQQVINGTYIPPLWASKYAKEFII